MPVGDITRSEHGEGAVLVEPGEDAPPELLDARRRHHPVVRVEQRRDDGAELCARQGR